MKNQEQLVTHHITSLGHALDQGPVYWTYFQCILLSFLPWKKNTD
jgi:hypothetical protein